MALRVLSWLVILFACFYGIGSYPLLDNNEGLYASIARDMLTNRQFVIPHLLGLPYLEKPPMLYWLMALSMSVFGVNEWAAHLVPALSFFMTAALLQRFVTRITGNESTGFTAALMLATSLPMLIFGREILCDMLLCGFFSAALFEIYLWQENARKRHLLSFYAFLALGVLTKGLIVIVLAGITIVTFYLWERRPLRHYLSTLAPLGIAVFLLIAAPWHIAAMLQEKGFAWFYFINEHVMRFLNKREPHDYYTGPWWYYLPRILLYLFPWTLFLLIFLHRPRPSTSPYPSAARFLWSWFLVCLMFFSAAGSKANYYMIIGMPALVALIAMYLQPIMETGHRVTRSLASSSFAMLLILLWFTQYFCVDNYDFLSPLCSNTPPQYITGIIVYTIACIVLCWRVPLRWLATLVSAHIFLLLPLLIHIAGSSSSLISQKAVAEQLQSSLASKVVLYQDFEDISALAFYLKKPLLIADSRSNDLLYGQKQQVKPALFPSLDSWADNKPYLPMVVLKHKLFRLMDALHEQHVDMRNVCVTQRFERVAIVSMCDHGH